MDSVFEEAGACGRYQIMHVILTQLPRFASTWSMYFMMFGAYEPGWRCSNVSDSSMYLNNTFNGTNYATMANRLSDSMSNVSSSPLSLSSSSSSSLHLVEEIVLNTQQNLHGLFTTNESKNSSLPDHPSYKGTCGDIKSCGPVEFSPESRTIVTEFELVCDRAWIVRAILLAQGIGYFFGPLLAGQVGEIFGRKVTVYGCVFIMSIANCVALFSTNWIMFAACSVVMGATAFATVGGSSVFSMELLNARWRGYFASVPMANLALCSFVFISAALKNWIHVYLVSLSISVISCVGFFIIPDSPRWLMINGHQAKAEAAILKIARFNKSSTAAQHRAVNRLRELAKPERRTTNYTYIDLLRNKQLLSCTLRFGVVFFVSETTHMTTTFGIKSLPGDYYMNAIEANCIEALAVLWVGPLCNSLGRRYSGLLFGSIGLISSLSIALTQELVETETAKALVVKIFAYLAKSSSQCMFVTALTFSSETFPTVVRNVSVGILACSSGLAGLVTPFLLPGNDAGSLTVSFSIMCGLYLCNVILFPSFQETRRRVLMDGLEDGQRGTYHGPREGGDGGGDCDDDDGGGKDDSGDYRDDDSDDDDIDIGDSKA